MHRFSYLFRHHTGLLVALLLGITAVAGVGLTRLTIDDVPSSLFRSDDAQFQRLEEVWDTFGSDDGDVLLLVRGQALTKRLEGSALADLTRAAQSVQGVRSVHSPSRLVQRGPLGLPVPLWPGPDAPEVQWTDLASKAAAHPLGSGQLLSADGKAALIVVQLEGKDQAIDSLRAPVAALQRLAQEVNAKQLLNVKVSGIPPLRIVIFDAIRREQVLFASLGALFGLIVGTIVFRRLGPVLVTSAASILASVWSLGALGLFGQPLNLMTTELPLLILVIAFTDAVHLMVHVLRKREEGMSPMDAGASAIRVLGVPCALTSLTTGIGFASLAVSRVEVIQNFGILFACSVGLTFISVLIVVPLLSAWCLGDPQGPSLAQRYAFLHAPAESSMRWILKRAGLVSSLGAALTLLMVLVCLQLVPENRLTEAVPSGHQAVDALGAIEASFGGSLWGAVVIEWDPKTHAKAASTDLAAILKETENRLQANAFTHGPISARALAEIGTGNPGRIGQVSQLPGGAGKRFLRPELGRALVTYRVPDAGSLEAEPAYARLEATCKELTDKYPGFAMHPTGTGYIARRNINLIITDFSRGLWLASGIIVLVLAGAFRSWRLGIIAVLPNVFPLAVAGSILVLLGIELQIAAVLAFTVCLGIAVDDTIHILAQFQVERRAGHSPSEAAVRSFLHVSRALLATTLVLLCGFGVMFLSTIATSVLFALIATVGLLAALVGDLILLPAVLTAVLGSASTSAEPETSSP